MTAPYHTGKPLRNLTRRSRRVTVVKILMIGNSPRKRTRHQRREGALLPKARSAAVYLLASSLHLFNKAEELRELLQFNNLHSFKLWEIRMGRPNTSTMMRNMSRRMMQKAKSQKQQRVEVLKKLRELRKAIREALVPASTTAIIILSYQRILNLDFPSRSYQLRESLIKSHWLRMMKTQNKLNPLIHLVKEIENSPR